MMIYAINVKSGTERLVASHINIICQKQSRTDIKKIIVPSRTTLVLTETKVRRTTKAIFNSYIFIQVHSNEGQNYEEMAPSLYQFLRNASPHIRQILPHNLQLDEYKRFLEAEHLNEIEVIITTPQETQLKISQLNHLEAKEKGLLKKRKDYIRYIQNILKSKGKNISINFNNYSISLISNTKTMVDLFSNSSLTIQDLIKNPFRTLQLIGRDLISP